MCANMVNSFGAVMEEFEVRDAIENVLSTKPEHVLPYRHEISFSYKSEPMAMAF